MIKRVLHLVFLVFFLIQAAVGGQGSEVKRILGEIRSALGGEQTLAAVKTLAMEGQTTRVSPSGESIAQDFEIAIDLEPRAPKYMKRDVVANMGGSVVTRRSGFNGNELIYDMEMPPELSANGMIRMTSMGSAGPNATPEQIAEQAKQRLVNAKREFTRLAIAVLGDTTAAYPVDFKYVGIFDTTGGSKADKLEITSTDGFKAMLWVDGKSHLPIMLTWMDKEPIRLNMQAGGGGSISVGGGATVITSAIDGSRTPEEMQAEMQRRIKEADSNRRVVEFRVMYGDYKTVDGVRVPTRLQHSIDGTATEQVTIAKITVNPKVDAAKFRTK